MLKLHISPSERYSSLGLVIAMQTAQAGSYRCTSVFYPLPTDWANLPLLFPGANIIGRRVSP